MITDQEKTCLITGATSGIGKEAALELARRGMNIIFNTRDESRGHKVKEELTRDSGNQNIDVLFCNLASFRSVCEFTSKVKNKYDKIDVLINNAGIWTSKKELSEDGIELQFAVNHLSHFLLTRHLMDLMGKSPQARIINVSSGVHYRGKIDLSDPESKSKSYVSINAYTQSKVANILFTKELAKRLNGTGITANSLAPGWVYTGLFRDTNQFVKTAARWFALTPEQGAQTIIYLASSSEVEQISGEFFRNEKVRRSAKVTYDTELSEKLWKLSEDYLKDYITC
jgi:NAD(P)-dependent dehydrogenase (short-subunit alcohol dehydrogenase family)